MEHGQNRLKEDAGHQRAIEEFKGIYDTLQTAVAFAASKKTTPMPLDKRSNPQDENRHVPDGLGSKLADDTPIPSEQRDARLVQVANTTNTATLSDHGSNIMRNLETLASIRGLVRATWLDYRVRKGDFYDAAPLSRYAFALSRGVIAELNATSTGARTLYESVVRLKGRLGSTGSKSGYDDLCCVRASKILALVLESIVLTHSESEDVILRRNELLQRCRECHPLAYRLCLVTKLLPERAKGQQEWVAFYEQTDPLLLTLRELRNTQEVTMEAAVVVQLYLELYETTPQMLNCRHFKTLVTAARTMKKSLTAFDNAVEKQPPASELRSEHGQICRSIVDGVIALDQAVPKLAKGVKSPTHTLRFLLAHLPLLCGSVYAALTDSFYLDGIQMSQYDSQVTAVAHLYRTTEFVVDSQNWAQFEEFVALQGKETLGLESSNDEEYDPLNAAIEISIALGVPWVEFEKLELNGGSTDRLPLPWTTSAESLALPVNQHSLLRVERLETADQCNRAQLTSPDQSRHDITLLAHDKMRQPKMIAAHPEIHNALRRQDRLCPAQLLEILSDCLAADAQHLKFNHHDLTLSCWELLRTISRDHDHTLRASRDLWGKEAASGKSNVVDDIMWEAIALAVIAERTIRRILERRARCCTR